jgi:hypothetical protein
LEGGKEKEESHKGPPTKLLNERVEYSPEAPTPSFWMS